MFIDTMEENSVDKVGKGGRPKGKTAIELGEVLSVSRRTGSKLPDKLPSSSPTPSTVGPGTGSTTPSGTRTSDRAGLYLLKKTIGQFSFSKLPKNLAILQRFLDIYGETQSEKAAVKQTASELKDVWKHHFGLKLVYGVESDGDDEIVSEAIKLVVMDNKIENKILNLYRDYHKLELENRRKDRTKGKSFELKQKTFLEETLDTPMNLAKRDSWSIFEKSGILDWKEDFTHLENQLAKDQKGGVAGYDLSQKEVDDENAEERRLQDEENNLIFNDDNANDSDENDTNWVPPECKGRRKKQKADIMGDVSLTGDRLGLSVRQRAMFAATVCHAAQVPISETNISKTTAWRRGQKKRVTKAAEIKEKLNPPDCIIGHWAGKCSERCCVYVSGVEENKTIGTMGSHSKG